MRPPFRPATRAALRLSAVIVCCALAACNQLPPEPRPTGTLEPSITESSPIPAHPKPNGACKLLKSSERSALVGMSMDAVVPVAPAAGTLECIWVHSPSGPARAAIRVVALSAPVWARQAAPQISATINDPSTKKSIARSLKTALIELSHGTDKLSDDRICEIFLLLVKAHGMRESDMVGYSTIGAMPAAYANSCDDGVMLLAGYGEYGLRPSLALNHGVVRLAEAAHGRAVGLFGGKPGAKQGGRSTAGASPGVKKSSPTPTGSATSPVYGKASPSPTER